ncbi:phage holin family protein [Montanilutibacter psychrotolerans]|uniref:phage holin family protein n=1 Tax=Montanilutibacter psychrotolerans TaxID=1327343 RepID=UPI001CC1FEA6|nr:phage holin family protein [Lysobacter psychrotolerans]
MPGPEGPPPDIAEALRQLGQTGRASLGAATDAAKAFRSLIAADVSLARSAFGRSLAFTGVAIAFGASSWLLLMAAAVAFLSGSLGWSWATSLLVTAALSILITVYGAWQAVRYFEHTRLKATRRQLARLGIGELSDFTPEPGSPERTRDRTRHDPPQTPDGKPLKDRRGIDVTPP